jgi:hypothetical protein
MKTECCAASELCWEANRETLLGSGNWVTAALSFFICVSLNSTLAQSAANVAQDQPGMVEESVLSLDGSWHFQPAGGVEREIAVPSFWERQPDLRTVHQGVYWRNFDVPESFRGRRILLRFDAVGDAADVSVNGQHAGEHVGPDLPFEVDINGLVVAPSSSNRLEVAVRDDSFFSIPRQSKDWRNRKSWIPRGMGANNRKGLYQSVSMRARPPIWLADARIQTSVRRREISVHYQIFNSRPLTARARLKGEVLPVAGAAPLMTLARDDVELPGYVTTTVAITSPFGAGVELWQPNHPTLYTLRTTLAGPAGSIARMETQFGFREVWFEGIHFYLNGIRCNLRGESPAYSEKAEMFATRNSAAEMVGRYQQANFNVLRFHSMPAPAHVLQVCDELGMLVIDESAIYASWMMLMPEHPEWMDFCREHLVRWVHRDRNHPSVVLWSAENEGLNVQALTPAMLMEFRRIIDGEDGSRPVIFDGDGTGYGAFPASNKHYAKTIDDLKDQGGRSSGYARDLRSDIYWASGYHQEIPLGCGEFLFPYEPGLRDKEREVCYMMGLQTRGYRLSDWYDIRPYNPSYTGFLRKQGVRTGYEDAYEVIVKSFAPVAVFDKEYDALGPYPKPPTLKAGEAARRTLLIYNDAFTDEQVQVSWQAKLADRRIDGGERTLQIPLGNHAIVDITFTPDSPGELRLELISSKAGREQFRDVRPFSVE